MKKIIGKINETGTLLVEALAMLGLISMVTPVLYKKAAERTTELQDINASSQLRAIATAMDAYLTDNFAKITRGEGNEFANFVLTNDENYDRNPDPVTIDISTLKDYLPYGMMSGANGDVMRSSKLFNNVYNNGDNSNYKIVVRLNRDLDDNNQPLAETLTGFIVAVPKTGIVNSTRAARIASMVGSNGGVTEVVGDNTNVNGTQGIWHVSGADLGGGLADNTLVISSLQPITSQGLSNENVLYRVPMPDNDYALNTMTTDLFMGTDADNTRNIRMVNQIVMTPNASRMVSPGGDATPKANTVGEDNLAAELNNALYIGNGGGANMEGELRAMMRQFVIRDNGADGPDLDMYMGEGNRDADAPTFHVGEDNLTYGKPAGVMYLQAADDHFEYSPRVGNPNLYATVTSFSAVDKTLVVASPDGQRNDGYVTIGEDYQQQNAPLTTYNGTVGTVATSDADRNYRLSVNGSIYAKDTILGGKIAGYDADASKLRAGIQRGSFNAGINNDDSFFLLADTIDANNSVFSLSTNGHNMVQGNIPNRPLVYAKTGTNAGFTVDTGSYNGGIDLIAGRTALLDANNAVNNMPQLSEVRIGAENGVYLSTYTTNGSNLISNAPVSIQGTMMQAYRRVYDVNSIKKQKRTIDIITDDYIATTNNSSNTARYIVEGMEFDVGRRTSGSDITDGTKIGANDRISAGAVRTRSILNIRPDNYGAPEKTEYGKVTTRFTGGIGVYDYSSVINEAERNLPNKKHPAALFIDKGKFEIRATEGATYSGSNVIDKSDLILAVDNNLSDHYSSNVGNYGSVYIRKGSVNIETNRAKRMSSHDIMMDYGDNSGSSAPTTRPQNAKGYIAADRFVSHYANEGEDKKMMTRSIEAAKGMKDANGVGIIPSNDKIHQSYERYEVNPAYTSVMHDIKLTTRGGARLSDILPDFINKGIYIVDTNYLEEAVGNWTLPNFNVKNCGTSANTCKEAEQATDKVSAYVGFVPTPICPPGYAKVITLTPAGWAMSQAGKLTIASGTNRPDVNLPDAQEVLTQNSLTSSDAAPIYLDYQKSTWLRSEVRPVYSGHLNNSSAPKDFNGWGLIMGFIYPHSKYSNLVPNSGVYNDTHLYTGANSTSHHGTSISERIYWNLFPVYNNEIEGYATVYCYFDRNNGNYSPEYVEPYDQLKSFQNTSLSNINNNVKSYRSDTGDSVKYIDRLNDRKLKYRDPW